MPQDIPTNIATGNVRSRRKRNVARPNPVHVQTNMQPPAAKLTRKMNSVASAPGPADVGLLDFDAAYGLCSLVGILFY